MSCKKRKQSKLTCMLIVSNPKREEKRYYYCGECKSWHTTKKDKL